MRDIEAEEAGRRLWVNRKILEVMERYGFQLVEPSPIESLETLEAKCGPSIREEIYWFEDKARRKLGLRFDLTVGLARMVASRPDWATPLKLCALSNMWRYDEPQYGRYRCFYQWDAEIFGSPLPEADAEVIALSVDVLENLGLKDFEVRISNRRLVEAFLSQLGLENQEKREAVLRVIDKRGKLEENRFTQELENLNLAAEQRNRLLDFISIKKEPEAALAVLAETPWKSPEAERGLEELRRVVDSLKLLGKTAPCLLDMSVIRGIGYYDGVVFEIYDRMEAALGAVVGGGRYDGLCRVYGRDLPATGTAGGIERLLIALEKAGSIPSSTQAPQVFVAAATSEVRGKALELAGWLRAQGISVDYDLKNRPLKGQLEYADASGIPFALVVGPRELEKGLVRLRDLRKRMEAEVKIEEVPSKVSGVEG
ncbi:histidine--tRNA ligase [Candidatus Hecatella orcuttiae]|jgi:histidyl-tRNA synthetase|uniref:histidine--tRNA ligase n=1 Tax=Candidatus Hecatella orcuttiae TaxID=1935119 RepID=UPI0028682B06|nr:histidine--tRNA ligase [Candidatus Hecatella orcuttiae]